ncbi:MAG: Zn-dependent hydrolase [Patescibacteria group bacterium]
MIYQNIQIKKLKHATFQIFWNDKVIYIDPFRLENNLPKADYLFITHEHFDHFNPDDIRKILKEETKIITIELVAKEIKTWINTDNLIIVEPNNYYEIDDFSFQTTSAYNINKFRAPGEVFHPKEDKRVGYVLNLDGVKIYHCGDTDFIEEMKKLKDIDVALICVSGTYVMTPEEAAEAVNYFKPKIAIPMHYGEIVGSIDDAYKFKELAKVEVIID